MSDANIDINQKIIPDDIISVIKMTNNVYIKF